MPPASLPPIGSPAMSWEDAVLWLRGQPDAQALVQACFYDDPLAEAARRYAASAEWQAVRRFLPRQPSSALDLGAGRGIASYALARDGHRVTALEPDPSAVVGAGAIRALARAGGLAIDVVETWGEDLPFPSDSFDVVHCRQVLHHARDLRALCRQIGRVLRPGGVFIATREHVLSRSDDLPVFLASHPLHHLYGGENAYRLDEYEGAIAQGGIVLDRTLNPMQSDINLYPETIASTKRRWARRLHLPAAAATCIPDALLGWVGARSTVAGRLYSFVGRKPHG